MHIGLTYDLRDAYLAAGYGEEETAEFDRADTIEALEEALAALGHVPDRIGHVRQFVGRLAAGDRWDLMFNIAEGLHGAARESQVPALLDAFAIPYTFSDPLVTAVALDKGLTKLALREQGIPTPPFAVVRTAGDVPGIDLPYPLFVKPVAEGTGKGITAASKIEDAAALHAACRELLTRFRQPVLVETYLPGREFTVGILGTGPAAEILGTLEVVLLADAEPGAYSYVNKDRCEELVEYRFVRGTDDAEVAVAEQIALAAWRALGCRDGGRVDLRSDGRHCPQFIEINPLAGLHPFHSDLPMIATAVGVPYCELIARIVDSAAERRTREGLYMPAPASR